VTEAMVCKGLAMMRFGSLIAKPQRLRPKSIQSTTDIGQKYGVLLQQHGVSSNK
jgi:hypothetical protein